MASEDIGVVCEIVTNLALEQLAGQWGIEHQPIETGLKVAVPDFRLTSYESGAMIYLQVTFAGSKHDSHKKFWRNLGELQEIKRVINPEPKVIAVTFGTEYLNYIPHIYRVAWDNSVFFGVMGEDFDNLVGSVAEWGQLKYPDRLARARELFAGSSEIMRVAQALSVALDGTGLEDSLWSSPCFRSDPTSSSARGAKETRLRRGIAAMLLARPPEAIVEDPSSLEKDSVAELIALRFLRPSLIGPIVVDPDINAARESLGLEQCKTLIRTAPIDRMKPWISTVTSAAHIVERAEEWASCWVNLTPRAVFETLKGESWPAFTEPEVFISLFELIKASTKRRQSVGSEQLLRLTRSDETNPDRMNQYREILDREPVIRDLQTIRLGLQSIVSPGGEQRYSIIEDDLLRIALTLYEHYITSISSKQLDRGIKTMVDFIVSTYFNVKVVTYQHFDPIGELIRLKLGKERIPYQVLQVKSCFADLVRCSGIKIDPRSTQTRVIAVENHLINWQSVTEDGRDHKRKELCGRAVALRYGWNQEMSQFESRPQIKRLVLVIDGPMRQDDVDALAQSGWDEIYYPDELDLLIESLRKSATGL